MIGAGRGWCDFNGHSSDGSRRNPCDSGVILDDSAVIRLVSEVIPRVSARIP